MTPRVLVACYEAPGWGGASTVAHDLAHELHHARYDIGVMTLVERADLPYYQSVFGRDFANPHGLPHALLCPLEEPLAGRQPSVIDAIERTAPDVVLAIGGAAASLAVRAAPSRRVVFFAAGCQQAKMMILQGLAADVADLERRLRQSRGWPPRLSADESVAVERADLVLSNSPLVSSLMGSLYPVHRGKMYPEPLSLAPWIHAVANAHRDLAQPFDRRDIDVLFVASAWDRPEKNYDTVEGLIGAVGGRSVHIAGEVEQRVSGAEHHGLIADRRELFALMGRAKTLVCPSLFDAAPGILFEGSALGCNLVATPNCGNAAMCHDALIAERATVESIAPVIERSLSRKYADRLQLISAADASRRLMALLTALTRVPVDSRTAEDRVEQISAAPLTRDVNDHPLPICADGPITRSAFRAQQQRGPAAPRRGVRAIARAAAEHAALAVYDGVLATLSWWPLGRGRHRRRAEGPRRIAYYTWRFPVLSQTFVHRELAALVASGVDVRVIADGRDQEHELDADAASLLSRVEYVDAATRPSGDRRILLRHPFRAAHVLMYVITHRYGPRKAVREDLVVFAQVLRVATAIDTLRADHVHAPWADRAAFIAMLAARLLGLPYSLQARAHDIHRESYAIGLDEKLSHAEVVVTNTEYNQRHLAALVPRLPPTRLVTIYNGLPLERFTPPARPTSPSSPTKLLSVARLIEQKGLDDLLRACRLLEDRGRPFSCDIVGAAETPLYTAFAVRLMERFDELGLAHRVTFHGAEPFAAIMERYRAADIFVLPCVIAEDGSRDVTPNAVLEAMAMTLPVVSTTITGLPEIVEDEVSGLLVPPRDPPALAAAIERLMDDPGLRVRLGQAARARIEARFDLRRNVETRVALFRSIAEAPARVGARR